MVRLWVFAVLMTLVAVSPSFADDHGGGSGQWTMAVGATAGSVVLDASLADYHWDTRPTGQWGFQATAYRGRFATSARVWFAQTVQFTGIPGEAQAPTVHMTGVDVGGHIRAFSYYGYELWGQLHAGRLHLGYSPDAITVDVSGLPQPLEVSFAPINEWEAGWGLELRKVLVRQMALVVQAEQTSFALDTAHRRGSEIVEQRDRFFNWNLRVQVSWLIPL